MLNHNTFRLSSPENMDGHQKWEVVPEIIMLITPYELWRPLVLFVYVCVCVCVFLIWKRKLTNVGPLEVTNAAWSFQTKK